MSFGGSGGGMVSDINVTPLVDVMLVLLVIFMITAPMIQDKKESQRKVGVDLPQTDAAPVDVEQEKKLILVIDDKLGFYIDDAKLADCQAEQAEKGETVECMGELETKLVENKKLQADKELYLMADRGIPYGVVVNAMARIKKAGVTQLGMVTDPPGGMPGAKKKGKRGP